MILAVIQGSLAFQRAQILVRYVLVDQSAFGCIEWDGGMAMRRVETSTSDVG